MSADYHPHLRKRLQGFKWGLVLLKVLLWLVLPLLLVMLALLLLAHQQQPLLYVLLVLPLLVLAPVLILVRHLEQRELPRLQRANRLLLGQTPLAARMLNSGLFSLNGLLAEFQLPRPLSDGRTRLSALLRAQGYLKWPREATAAEMYCLDTRDGSELVVLFGDQAVLGEFAEPVSAYRKARLTSLVSLTLLGVGGLILPLVGGYQYYAVYQAEAELKSAQASLAWPLAEAHVTHAEVERVRIPSGKI